jgi:hypothetical protein
LPPQRLPARETEDTEMKRNEAILEPDFAGNSHKCTAKDDTLPRNESKFPAPLASTFHRQLPGVVIGVLKGFDGNGVPLVAFGGGIRDNFYAARTTIDLTENDIGSEVALVFEHADRRKPIILGLLKPAARTPAAGSDVRPVEVNLDGRQVRLAADQEIVLSCGKASITLTRAGKVLIKGEYLLSRSAGVNRIKGGSVQIN